MWRNERRSLARLRQRINHCGLCFVCASETQCLIVYFPSNIMGARQARKDISINAETRDICRGARFRYNVSLMLKANKMYHDSWQSSVFARCPRDKEHAPASLNNYIPSPLVFDPSAYLQYCILKFKCFHLFETRLFRLKRLLSTIDVIHQISLRQVRAHDTRAAYFGTTQISISVRSCSLFSLRRAESNLVRLNMRTMM